MKRQSRPVARGAAHLSGGFGEPAAASVVAHRTLGIAFRIEGARAPSIQRRVRTAREGAAAARASLRERAATDRGSVAVGAALAFPIAAALRSAAIGAGSLGPHPEPIQESPGPRAARGARRGRRGLLARG